MASRLSHRSRPDSQPNVLECEHDARSFLEIYTEKKKQKEQRELERKKRESKIFDGNDRNEQEPEIGSDEISAKTSRNKCTGFDTQDCNKQDVSSTDTCGSYFYAGELTNLYSAPVFNDIHTTSMSLNRGRRENICFRWIRQSTWLPMKTFPFSPVQTVHGPFIYFYTPCERTLKFC